MDFLHAINNFLFYQNLKCFHDWTNCQASSSQWHGCGSIHIKGEWKLNRQLNRGHKGSKVLSANHEFPNSTSWKREGHIRMNKKRIPNVTSLTQPGGRERVVRMNKQWMSIVTSLTQPDGRERVVRMNKQWMPIITSLTQPDGRERVVRMNKQSMHIVTSLTQPDGRERVVRMSKQWIPIVTSLTWPNGRGRVVRVNKFNHNLKCYHD